MPNASSKVRTIFKSYNPVLTLTQILEQAPDLKGSEVSMALNYLMRQRYLTRKLIPNAVNVGRKQVWEYTYHTKRLPKEANEQTENSL
jgi:hypothetical protein